MKSVYITVVEHEETDSWAFYVNDKLRMSGKTKLWIDDLVTMINLATAADMKVLSSIEYVWAEEEYAPGSGEGFWPEFYGDVDVVSKLEASTPR